MTKAERQKEWETRIAEYRASGQSVKEWCAAHNVKPQQLWYWLRRNKTQKDAPSIKPTQWLPVEVSEGEAMDQNNALVVKVGVASIEVKPGFDPALLAEIVRTLVPLC
jgi:transposase-like protein